MAKASHEILDTTLSTSSMNWITKKRARHINLLENGMVGNGSSISVGATADPVDEESESEMHLDDDGDTDDRSHHLPYPSSVNDATPPPQLLGSFGRCCLTCLPINSRSGTPGLIQTITP